MGEPVTLEKQVASVAREIAMRKNVYPKWVASKRMKQEQADHEIAAMEAVIATLNAVASRKASIEETITGYLAKMASLGGDPGNVNAAHLAELIAQVAVSEA